jgi:hypothetical protein
MGARGFIGRSRSSSPLSSSLSSCFRPAFDTCFRPFNPDTLSPVASCGRLYPTRHSCAKCYPHCTRLYDLASTDTTIPLADDHIYDCLHRLDNVFSFQLPFLCPCVLAIVQRIHFSYPYVQNQNHDYQTAAHRRHRAYPNSVKPYIVPSSIFFIHFCSFYFPSSSSTKPRY